MQWNFDFLDSFKRGSEDNDASRVFTILLNRPLPPICTAVVESSDVVICADGGANRYIEMVSPEDIQKLRSFRRGQFLVTGDLDSIQPNVRFEFPFFLLNVFCVEDN